MSFFYMFRKVIFRFDIDFWAASIYSHFKSSKVVFKHLFSIYIFTHTRIPTSMWRYTSISISTYIYRYRNIYFS